MWDPEPYIASLETLAPPAVREGDRTGLRRFLLFTTLKHGERRPLFMSETHHELTQFRQGFVYERKAQLLVPCDFADHTFTAAALAQVRMLGWPVNWEEETGAVCDDRKRDGDVDRFLNEGWGFVVNSPLLTAKGDPTLSHRWPLRLGPEVSMTPQEKIWFRNFELIRRE